ncbi:MAG: universal stress protein [Actinomycetota bacterium]
MSVEGIATADAPPSGPRRWVVGTDGSAGARHAVDWAVAHAEGRATHIDVVAAWNTVAAASFGSPVVAPIDERSIANAVRRDLESLVGEVCPAASVPVAGRAVHGAPTRALLETAADAALLVVGSRGLGGFGRLLLGSTSTQCATHATIPTAVIPVDGVVGRQTQRVVVGCDGSPNAMAALRWAIDFASPGTAVEVVWVWDTTPLAVGADSFFFPEAADLSRDRFEHLVSKMTDHARRRQVVIEQSFVRGTPRRALSDAGARADLLVVGARGHGSVGAALLGSVSTWLLHHLGQPLVVVPDVDSGR